jgi:hypothetical protein
MVFLQKIFSRITEHAIKVLLKDYYFDLELASWLEAILWGKEKAIPQLTWFGISLTGREIEIIKMASKEMSSKRDRCAFISGRTVEKQSFE